MRIWVCMSFKMEEEWLFSSLFAWTCETRTCRTLGMKIKFWFWVPVAPGVPMLRAVAVALRIYLPKTKKAKQKKAVLLSVELRDFVILCLFLTLEVAVDIPVHWGLLPHISCTSARRGVWLCWWY